MTMISYNDFLANVTVAHMELLATFTAGQRVRVLESDTQGIADIKDGCLALFNAELLDRVAEGHERFNGDLYRTFDGYVVGAAVGYCWQLARERLALSREPLPPEEPPQQPA